MICTECCVKCCTLNYIFVWKRTCCKRDWTLSNDLVSKLVYCQLLIPLVTSVIQNHPSHYWDMLTLEYISILSALCYCVKCLLLLCSVVYMYMYLYVFFIVTQTLKLSFACDELCITMLIVIFFFVLPCCVPVYVSICLFYCDTDSEVKLYMWWTMYYYVNCYLPFDLLHTCICAYMFTLLKTSVLILGWALSRNVLFC